MRTATVQEIKQELQHLNPKQINDLCLRLARFKKENKELLTYLLFEEHNEDAYIQSIQDEMELLFEDMNMSHMYFAKKTLRKILRFAAKHIRYSNSKQTEVEVLLHFIKLMKEAGLTKPRHVQIYKIYEQQLKKTHKTIEALHEDLQFDYLKRWETLQS